MKGLSICIKDHDGKLDIPIHTNPGDVIIHNCNLIHSAGKNNSINKRRRAIGIIFIPIQCVLDKDLDDYYQKQLKEDIILQLKN